MFIDFQEFTDIEELLVLHTRIDAIVNAANMEVRFGGGISGAIGNATGRRAEIDAEAQRLINEFNQRVVINTIPAE